MYPAFRRAAVAEGTVGALQGIDTQIAESKEHATRFEAVLEKASKRLAALAKVDERHANNYEATLDRVNARGDTPAATPLARDPAPLADVEHA